MSLLIYITQRRESNRKKLQDVLLLFDLIIANRISFLLISSSLRKSNISILVEIVRKMHYGTLSFKIHKRKKG